MAGRVGVDLTLDDWDRLGRDIPTIVNLMPSGKYPDGGVLLCRRPAGGDASAGRRRQAAQRRADRLGRHDLRSEVEDVRNWNEEVIRPVDKALTAAAAASWCCAATSRPTAPS